MHSIQRTTQLTRPGRKNVLRERVCLSSQTLCRWNDTHPVCFMAAAAYLPAIPW